MSKRMADSKHRAETKRPVIDLEDTPMILYNGRLYPLNERTVEIVPWLDSTKFSFVDEAEEKPLEPADGH